MYFWRVGNFLVYSSAKVCRLVLDNSACPGNQRFKLKPFRTVTPYTGYRSRSVTISQLFFSEFCRLSFCGRHEPYLCPQPRVPLLIHLSNATQTPRFPSYTTFFGMFLLCISLGWTRIMTNAWDASISCFQPYAPIGAQRVLSGTAGCCTIELPIKIWTLLQNTWYNYLLSEGKCIGFSNTKDLLLVCPSRQMPKQNLLCMYMRNTVVCLFFSLRILEVSDLVAARASPTWAQCCSFTYG